jgi:hypothetical protein
MTGPVSLAYHLKSSEPALAESGEMRMNMQVFKQAVEAITRKLSAKWSPEASKDLQAAHGVSIEGELVNAVATDVAYDITNEVVSNLARLGSLNVIEFDGSQHDLMGDRINALVLNINKACNDIARRTNRGQGNFIIVSPLMLSMLQSGQDVKYEQLASPQEGSLHTGIQVVGMLNEKIKVIVSLTLPMDYDTIIVGYNGSSAIDTGYVYCPYVPLIASGVVMDPNTFTTMIRFMTRYGTYTCADGGPANSMNYYSTIKVKNLI